MNVSCPQCKTVFRVDPHKVPTEGVRARCSVCGGVFEVLAKEQPIVAAVSTPAPEAGPAEAAEAAAPAAAIGTVESPAPQAVEVEKPQPPEPEPLRTKPAPEPAAATPAAAPRSPFGEPDQEARARRLARALISDLAAYHPDRQEQGLKEGRLKELFQDELRKSWQEYVGHVGLDLAKSTPYFRDALNDILARGKRVF